MIILTLRSLSSMHACVELLIMADIPILVRLCIYEFIRCGVCMHAWCLFNERSGVRDKGGQRGGWFNSVLLIETKMK